MTSQHPQRYNGPPPGVDAPPTSHTPGAPNEGPRRDIVHRTSRHPMDRSMPDDISDHIVTENATLYNSLRDTERRLDALIVRKRLESTDPALRSATHVHPRILRVWVSNTVQNQSWQHTDDTTDRDDLFGIHDMPPIPSFRVRIEAKLLDEDNISDDFDAPPPSFGELPNEEVDHHRPRASVPLSRLDALQRTRFSHFFKQISFDFHRRSDLQAAGLAQINWTRPAHQANPNPHLAHQQQFSPALADQSPGANFDFLEFERKCDENIPVTISFYRDEPFRQRFSLSPQLSRLIDSEVEDRPSVLMGLWQYYKSHGIEPEGRNHGDEILQQLFSGQDVDPIHNHLAPLPPIALQYTIRTDRAYSDLASNDPSRYTVYDIPVLTYSSAPDLSLQLPSLTLSQPVVSSPHPLVVLQSILHLDEALAAVMRSLQDSKSKCIFLDSLARDPVRFISRWTSSQQHELALLMCEPDGFNLVSLRSSSLCPPYRSALSKSLSCPEEGSSLSQSPRGVWDSREILEAVSAFATRPRRP